MEKKEREREIIEGLKPLCICKGIKKRTIVEKIRSGCTTAEALRKATGAGGGPCKGKRCAPRIRELLKQLTTREQGTEKDRAAKNS